MRDFYVDPLAVHPMAMQYKYPHSKISTLSLILAHFPLVNELVFSTSAKKLSNISSLEQKVVISIFSCGRAGRILALGLISQIAIRVIGYISSQVYYLRTCCKIMAHECTMVRAGMLGLVISSPMNYIQTENIRNIFLM